MRTVAAKWDQFESSAIPPSMPPELHRLTKLAFYRGANAVLGIVHECGESDMSDAAGAAILQGLLDECIAFSATGGRG